MPELSREYPTRPLAAVSVAVEAEGRILLVQRRRAPWQGHWSLPGGLIELGETARVAAAREVLEETGLQVEIGALFNHHDRIDRDPDGRVRHHYVLLVFRATVMPDSPPACAGSDAGALLWAEWPELAHLPLTPDLEAILQPLRR